MSWPQLKQLAASGRLQPTDLVWTSPMANAVQGSTLKGLFPEVLSPTIVEPGPNDSFRPEYRPWPSPDSEAERRVGSRSTPPLWKRVLGGCGQVVVATVQHTVRPFLYLGSRFRGRSLRRRVQATRVTLGQRLYQARAGDRPLREQIHVLGEKIHNAEGDRAAIQKLTQARHALLDELASRALDQGTVPPEVEEALQGAREAQAESQSYQDLSKAARKVLLPAGGIGWLRVGIGYGVVAAMVVLILWLVPGSSGPTPENGSASPSNPQAASRELTTQEIYAQYAKSVALIRSEKTSGTGFLVGPGLLATNAHVIEFALVPQLQVYFPSAGEVGKKPLPVKLRYYNRPRDLAILEINSDLTPLAVQKDFQFQGGQRVTVIGNPNLDELTLENAVSQGLMSTRTKLEGKDFFQLSIAVNPGNSGGPVFDSRGQVIGVVTLKAKEKEGIAFCIPPEDLTRALADLEKLPPQRLAEAEARHKLDVVFRRVVMAGAIYGKGLELYTQCIREAVRNRLPPNVGLAAAKKMFRKRFKDPEKEILEDVKAVVTTIGTESLIPEELRKKMMDLWATYQEIKSYVDTPRGTFQDIVRKHDELEEKFGRQVEALQKLLETDRGE